MAISKNIKRIVKERAHGCCEYCQCLAKFVPVPFVIEHIIPQVKGGTDVLSNLAFSCHGCNGSKYDKTTALDPITNEVVSLYHPRRDDWKSHFIWSEDATRINGITPTGRATIIALHLNREELINFRSVLVLFGNHPPSHTLPS